jgi:hypothetical protein
MRSLKAPTFSDLTSREIAATIVWRLFFVGEN